METHSSVLTWKTQGQGSLVGCRLWGRIELDTTEETQQPEMEILAGLSPIFHSYFCPNNTPSKKSFLTTIL